MLLEKESPAYGDGSALASSLGSPVINPAGAQPLPRFGIFPVFPKPGKGGRPSRTGRIPSRVVGPEHEKVNEELRAPSEELCQLRPPFIGVKTVLLVDPDPRQLPRQLFLRLEQLEARRQPLFT